jgi:hypothetical protein
MGDIVLGKLSYIGQFLSEEECQIIYDYAIENEERLINLGEDIYSAVKTKNPKGSLTGRYNLYNCLNIDILNPILKPKFKNLINYFNFDGELYIQCWINILRYGESLDIHRHVDYLDETYIYASGNIFIHGNPNPGTSFYYDDRIDNYKNRPGIIQVFHPIIEHGVRTYLNDDVRVSIAFDIGNQEMLEEDSILYRMK